MINTELEKALIYRKIINFEGFCECVLWVGVGAKGEKGLGT